MRSCGHNPVPLSSFALFCSNKFESFSKLLAVRFTAVATDLFQLEESIMSDGDSCDNFEDLTAHGRIYQSATR